VISLLFVGDKFDFHLDRGRVLRGSLHEDATCTADLREADRLVSNSNPSLGPLGCSRCLHTGHVRSRCINKIRCRACFNYGHIQRQCLTRARHRLVWMLKETPTNITD
jgi:hypothetical protein